MRNKYPGVCFRCGAHVASGSGHFQREAGRWLIRCKACVGKGNEPEPATPVQQEPGDG
jgi:DNA-directed RNA polymerase subunit RPC12/RpoP